MVKINWTLEAKDDLIEIANFIALDSKQFAISFIKKLKLKVLILNPSIRSGRIVPELGLDYIRELFLGRYRIIYRIVSDESVDIITVHHSARMLSNNQSIKELLN